VGPTRCPRTTRSSRSFAAWPRNLQPIPPPSPHSGAGVLETIEVSFTPHADGTLTRREVKKRLAGVGFYGGPLEPTFELSESAGGLQNVGMTAAHGEHMKASASSTPPLMAGSRRERRHVRRNLGLSGIPASRPDNRRVHRVREIRLIPPDCGSGHGLPAHRPDRGA